jgi:hypothetical protein
MRFDRDRLSGALKPVISVILLMANVGRHPWLEGQVAQ